MNKKQKLYEVIARMREKDPSCPSDLGLDGLVNDPSCEHINNCGLCAYDCWANVVVDYVIGEDK